MDNSDSDSSLAITVEWNLPAISKVLVPKATRYSISEPISISSLIDAAQSAKKGVNEILTHVIEKGCWPTTLSPAVAPECSHGFPYTEKECRYSPSHWTTGGLHPNHVIAKYIKKMTSYHPADLLARHGGQLDVAYGEGENEKMDIYGADVLPKSAKVFVFVHGGYWQEGSRKLSTVMVQNMFDRGVITAVIGSDLAPNASLTKIVSQISTAFKYLDDWCTRRGSSGLYLCGHSAGAHLIATSVLAGSKRLDNVKGVFLLSGIYDLKPLIGTYIDRPLGLTEDVAVGLSPIFQIRNNSDHCRRLLSNVNVRVVVGGLESVAFVEQSRHFFDSLKNSELCQDVGYHTIDNRDHFALIEGLDDSADTLFELMCTWMNLTNG